MHWPCDGWDFSAFFLFLLVFVLHLHGLQRYRPQNPTAHSNKPHHTSSYSRALGTHQEPTTCLNFSSGNKHSVLQILGGWDNSKRRHLCVLALTFLPQPCASALGHCHNQGAPLRVAEPSPMKTTCFLTPSPTSPAIMVSPQPTLPRGKLVHSTLVHLCHFICHIIAWTVFHGLSQFFHS